MSKLILALPGNEQMAAHIAEKSGATLADGEFRQFPDGESYVRLKTQVTGAKLALVCTLDRPDGKILPLLFTAGLARELGAASVGLVAPYLGYMRQDRRFKPGEAVTSTQFARLLSGAVDSLVTVDPHLHRVHDLAEIYACPTQVLHAAGLIAAWIRDQVEAPLLIGPDAESAQWVEAVAKDAGAPHIVLEKIRRGDREVAVSVPDVEKWRGHTPVLVDDIISTARTMVETVSVLRGAGMRPAVCVGVHGVFAPGAYEALVGTGARVVTSNAVKHPTNRIDLSGMIADAVGHLG